MTTNDRADTIKAIRTALRQRSGKAWSVRGGTGTAWGWIDISSPPARQPNGSMTLQDSVELGKLLDLPAAPHQHVSIPSSSAHRREYIARAKGEPYEVAEPYWD